MATSNFSKIKIGTLFTADGETYKKTTELTYDDSVGIERYIDPFFDKKINAPVVPAKPDVDTSAHVVKSDEAPAAKPKKAKKSKKAK